jgi:hypothetical protein
MIRSRQLDWRLAIRSSDLDPTARLVALVLDTWMNRHGVAWPSRSSIAAGCGITVKTAARAVDRLVAAGFLQVERSKGGKSDATHYRSNQYCATFPTPIEDASEFSTTGSPATPLPAPNGVTEAHLTGSLTAFQRGHQRPQKPSMNPSPNPSPARAQARELSTDTDEGQTTAAQRARLNAMSRGVGRPL